MPTLSLAMIVKNEAANLGRCLDSVHGLVDEIVVVDTGSGDGTLAIAEAHGARIGHFPWRDDFAAARNASLDLCRGDWILLLDADEAVAAQDHALLRQATAGREAAFTLVCRNYTRDAGARMFDQAVVPNVNAAGPGADYPFYADVALLRLVRRYPDLRFEGRVHELLDPYLRRKKLPIGHLPAVIHHFGKADAAREQAKLSYYLGLAERDAAARPKDPERQFLLMAQAQAAGHWDKALAAGLAYLRTGARVPAAVHTTLALAYQETGRNQESLPHLQAVLKEQPDHGLALCRLAMALARLGRWEEGRAPLARARAAHPRDPLVEVALAELEERAGRFGPAREALRAAIALDPGDPRLRQGLVELDLRGRMEAQAAADALEALRALPDQGGGLWHALAAGFLLKAGHAGPGRAILELGLATFPDHPGLRGLAAALARG